MIALAPSNPSAQGGLRSEAAAALGLAMIVFALFAFSAAMPLPGLWSLLPVVGTALALRFATAQTLAGRALAARPLVLAGLVSYSAYLWHQPLLAFARFRFDIQPSLAVAAAVFAATFALAYLSWRFVEQPFRDRSKISRRTVFALALVAVAAAIALGRAAAVYRGFPGRMPAIEGLADARDKSSLLYKCSDIEDLSPGALDALKDCRLGAPGKTPDFLLIGDSHAGSLAYGVSDAAFAAGRAGLLLASNACLPIIGLKGRYPRSEAACRDLHDNLIAIVRHFGVKLVILHARWEALGEGGFLAPEDLRAAAPQAAVKTHLIETLDELAAAGAQLSSSQARRVRPIACRRSSREKRATGFR